MVVFPWGHSFLRVAVDGFSGKGLEFIRIGIEV